MWPGGKICAGLEDVPGGFDDEPEAAAEDDLQLQDFDCQQEDENAIPYDMDGWEWAPSESEDEGINDTEAAAVPKNDATCMPKSDALVSEVEVVPKSDALVSTGKGVSRVAAERP